MNYTQLILHRFDPEWIHDRSIQFGSVVGKFKSFRWVLEKGCGIESDKLKVTLGNLDFPNPIGLAAGFDKNGEIVPVLQAIGFGFIEVGTVTPVAQPGNPKPRLFRLKPEKAVINRMGFNNKGVDALVRSLNKVSKRVPIGINLGKNKSTDISKAAQDYMIGVEKAWEVADYFTINISSPNTADLRELQGEEYLKPLIEAVLEKREQQRKKTSQYKQIWLKIAPDLEDSELEMICRTILDSNIDALVVSNTTIGRDQLPERWRSEAGGLSGRPLFELSNNVLEKAGKLLKDNIPLIGVGGIRSANDITTKMSLGASLVQIYTSLIFEGPGFVKLLKQDLLNV
ncbi:MAG: quinone-dependent dihydroorotate dehydrogenase [Proteobacteria bacterium]|nr:quinone-dependent dihydroorotate dehydrogenase [Pseudomonadota bacterium]